LSRACGASGAVRLTAPYVTPVASQANRET
jgi:hypothetical protein